MTGKIRPVKIEGDTALVTLSKGYVAMIDASDVPLVEGFNWTADECFSKDRKTVLGVYAHRKIKLPSGGHRKIYLHRLILGFPESREVDHRDYDTLNNRRKNLRVATRSQNTQNRGLQANNTSGRKGVSWDRSRGKWLAQIVFSKKSHYLGRFDSLEEAAAAYADANQKLHGEFGRVDRSA